MRDIKMVKIYVSYSKFYFLILYKLNYTSYEVIYYTEYIYNDCHERTQTRIRERVQPVRH